LGFGRDQFRKLVDITENKALAHDFQGASWTRNEDWELIEYLQSEEEQTDKVDLTAYTNQLRRALSDRLPVSKVPF